MEPEDDYTIYKLIKKEVEAISPNLAGLPEIVVLTKTDEVDQKTITKYVNKFGNAINTL